MTRVMSALCALSLVLVTACGDSAPPTSDAVPEDESALGSFETQPQFETEPGVTSATGGADDDELGGDDDPADAGAPDALGGGGGDAGVDGPGGEDAVAEDAGPEDPGPCTKDQDCPDDPPNSCMEHVCVVATGACGYTPKANGASCSGDPCIAGETCTAGNCAGGTGPEICDDDDPCTDDSCVDGVGCVFDQQPGCCTVKCDGKSCGDDGCGGSCGHCSGGEVCSTAGTCVPDTPGETCEQPLHVGPLPWSNSSATAGSSVYEHGAAACPQADSPAGAGSPDHVYLFDVPADGTYQFRMSTSFDATVYVVSDCADVDSTCLGGMDAKAASGTEELLAWLEGGTTVYVIVDGGGSAAGQMGNYTLLVDTVEDDGGGPDDTGIVAGNGNTCDGPLVVGTLPFDGGGDTAGATNDYYYESNTCVGETGGWGYGSRDQVWALTAPTADTYFVELEADFDATIYAVTSCEVIDSTTCLRASDSGYGSESVVLELQASQTVYLIVDGVSNGVDLSGTYSLAVTTL